MTASAGERPGHSVGWVGRLRDPNIPERGSGERNHRGRQSYLLEFSGRAKGKTTALTATATANINFYITVQMSSLYMLLRVTDYSYRIRKCMYVNNIHARLYFIRAHLRRKISV